MNFCMFIKVFFIPLILTKVSVEIKLWVAALFFFTFKLQGIQIQVKKYPSSNIPIYTIFVTTSSTW